MASKRLGDRRVLSERLRGMRFMKQKEEREHRQRLEREQRDREQGMYWTLEDGDAADTDEPCGPIVIEEGGMADNTLWGRLGRRTFGNIKTDQADEGDACEMHDDNVDGPEGGPAAGRSARQGRNAGQQGEREKEMLFGGLKGAVRKRDNNALHFTRGGRKRQDHPPSYQ